MISSRIFIVGCARSGTTLVQSLIASHQNVTSFPESHFFAKLASSRWILRKLGVASRSIKSHINEFLRKCDCADSSTLQGGTIYTQRTATKSFIRSLDKIAHKESSIAWVEKTPQHLHYISLIEKYVPTPLFVHVVRAGEDVVASMYDVTHNYPKEWGGRRSLQQCIDRWNRDIAITHDLLRKPNHVVVTYQEAVKRQEDLMGCLCKFVGLSEWSRTRNPNDKDIIDQIVTDEEEWKSKDRKRVGRPERKFCKILTDFQRQDIRDRLENEKYREVNQTSVLKK